MEDVHDVVELRRDVRGQHGRPDAKDRGQPAHHQIVRVARIPVQVRLVDIVGPDGVERRDVAGHAGHEAGQERSETQAEHARWEVMEKHDGDGEVVIELRLSVLVPGERSGGLIYLVRDEARRRSGLGGADDHGLGAHAGPGARR